MTQAWLGLGGNMGKVEQALSAALQRLDGHAQIAVTKVSPLYRTPPWGPVAQDWFLNCCAEVETGLSPRDLLTACQTVERAGNRVRNVRWGPRTIDVDIIAMDGVRCEENGLSIPHPRAVERAFVMVPLADIAPRLTLNAHPAVEHAARLHDPDMEQLDRPENWWRQPVA